MRKINTYSTIYLGEFRCSKQKLTRRQKAKMWASEFFTTRRMAYLAVFSALAGILYIVLKFPLPIFPVFLEVNFSDVPILVSGFMLGPTAGGVVVVMRFALKMITGTSMTFGVGELADLILGLAFVLPAAIIYNKYKSKKSAIAGLAIASVASIGFALLLNWLVIVPIFAAVLPGGMYTIVNAVAAVFPSVTVDNFFSVYLPAVVIPFNALRVASCSLIAFGLYQGLKRADRRLFPSKSKAKPKNTLG